MRELKKQELVQVSGAGDCCCPAPEPHKPGGNPGNYKPVGNAGEKGGKFTSGSQTVNGNGRAGASAA
jgi:hypothetical protein